MIEPLRPYRRLVREPAVHLVGDRKRGEELTSGGAGVLCRCEHGREVVARVARLAGGEVRVVEVEVADERSVVERRAVGRRPAASDERAEGAAAEVLQADVLQRGGARVTGVLWIESPWNLEDADQVSAMADAIGSTVRRPAVMRAEASVCAWIMKPASAGLALAGSSSTVSSA